jgi:hypothetical protein
MMITATTAPGKTLLNANDHTLILIALQYLLELQRDWARTGTAGKTTSIVLPYGGSYGLGVVYAAKMIKAS